MLNPVPLHKEIRPTQKMTITLNSEGYPLIAELWRGKHGVGAVYLTADGRVCNPTRQGGNYREIKETDMVFDSSGSLSPAIHFFNDSQMTHL